VRLLVIIRPVFKICMILLVTLMLLNCQVIRPRPPVSNLPVRVKNGFDALVISIQAGLTKKGVKVVNIGQDYLISIPSALLFPDQSPRLTWGSYAILNEVVRLIKQFRKVGVNVTSYASHYKSARRERALTQQRARNVAAYLLSQDIDSRFIFTEGAGSDKPISRHIFGGDKSPSSRIEITFRDAIV